MYDMLIGAGLTVIILGVGDIVLSLLLHTDEDD